MTIERAKEELAACRTQQRHLRKRISALRTFLEAQGIDPSRPKEDLSARNQSIYSRHLDGLSWDELAKEFRLSKEHLKQLCKRIEILNAKKARKAQEHEDEE